MATVESSKSVPMRDRNSWRSVATYYAIACGVSWVFWSPLIAGSDGLKILEIAPPVPVFISIGTLGPLVACYLVHRLCDGNWRAVQLLPRHALQWVWTVGGPLLIVFCFFVVFPALISDGPPNTWRWRPSRLAGLFVPMFNYNILAGPLFEEFGWRGFLQSRLQSLMPTWIAATSVGALWAVWHLPLFFLQGWSSASPLVYLLILVVLSLVMAFGFNSSGRSVLVAILMHSAFNSSPRFLGEYLGATSTRALPGGEWYVAATFLLVGAGLAITSRGRLTSSPAS